MIDLNYKHDLDTSLTESTEIKPQKFSLNANLHEALRSNTICQYSIIQSRSWVNFKPTGRGGYNTKLQPNPLKKFKISC